MASETLTSSINWTALATAKAEADIITIPSGYVLTIDQTLFGDTQAENDLKAGVAIVCTSGFSKMVIANTDTAKALRFYGDETALLQIKNGCTLDVQGGYIPIYTGTGANSQTTSGWTTAGYHAKDEPGVIEVEKLGYFEVLQPITNLISVGDTFTNNSKTFTVANIFEDIDETSYRIVMQRTSGSGDPSSGSTQFTISTGNGSTFTTTWDYYYEPWLSIGDLALSDVGVDSLGNLFLYNTTTGVITFGDYGNAVAGKGGNKPANGAKVRVYNIGIGSIGAGTPVFNATATGNFELAVNDGGNCIFKKCYFFGFYFNLYHCQRLTMDKVGGIVDFVYSTSFDITCYRVYCGANRYFSGTPLYVESSKKAKIRNSLFATKAKSDPFFIYQSPDTDLLGSGAMALKRTGENRLVLISQSSGVKMSRGPFVGGYVKFSSSNKCTLKNAKHSDSPHGSVFGSNYYVPLSFGSSEDCVVDGFDLIPEGKAATGINVVVETSLNTKLRNINYPSAATYFADVSSGCEYVRCKVGTPGTAILNGGGSSKQGLLIQDIEQSTISVQIFPNNAEPGNCIVKACDTSGGNPSIYAIQNTIFWEGRTSTTQGFMALTACPQTQDKAYYTLSGSSIKFDYNALAYFTQSNGDEIIWEWPHVIKGVSSFRNLTPTSSGGSNSDRLDYFYSIDKLDGNGYGSFLALTGSNLSAETGFTAAVGFKLKVKATRRSGTGTDNSTGMGQFKWYTNVDTSVKYPLSLVKINLSGVVVNSSYRIFRGYTEADSKDATKLIAAGTASTAAFAIDSVAYNGDETITILLRKSSTSSNPDYLPYESQTSLTEAGASVVAQQIPDTIST